MAFAPRFIAAAFVALSLAVLVPAVRAQQMPTKDSTCFFSDGSAMWIQYTPEPYPVKKGQVWTPGNRPVALFLDTAVTIEAVTLPMGAYGVYFLREKNWTLIINRHAKPASEYDPKGDLVRSKMGSSQFQQKLERPQVALVHPAPSQCDIQLYAAESMAWDEFKQKEGVASVSSKQGDKR